MEIVDRVVHKTNGWRQTAQFHVIFHGIELMSIILFLISSIQYNHKEIHFYFTFIKMLYGIDQMCSSFLFVNESPHLIQNCSVMWCPPNEIIIMRTWSSHNPRKLNAQPVILDKNFLYYYWNGFLGVGRVLHMEPPRILFPLKYTGEPTWLNTDELSF